MDLFSIISRYGPGGACFSSLPLKPLIFNYGSKNKQIQEFMGTRATVERDGKFDGPGRFLNPLCPAGSSLVLSTEQFLPFVPDIPEDLSSALDIRHLFFSWSNSEFEQWDSLVSCSSHSCKQVCTGCNSHTFKLSFSELPHPILHIL